MRLRNDKRLLALVTIFVFSTTLCMPLSVKIVQADEMGPSSGGFSDPGPSYSDPGPGMVGPGPGSLGPMGPGMMGPGMMGPGPGSPGPMGPGMMGPGVPPDAGSGWNVDSSGNWTPPVDWAPPPGWTPPAGWQSGQPIPGNTAPWNQAGMTGTGSLPIIGPPPGMFGQGGMFGPGGPAIGDILDISGTGSAESNLGHGSVPSGIFGSNAGFFNAGINTPQAQGMTGPNGPGSPPDAGSGWNVDSSGNWTPPADWAPPLGWTPPAGWHPGQPIPEGDAPWKQVPADRTSGMVEPLRFIPGTLIKLPTDMTVEQVMEDFDPFTFGISLPSFLTAEDFKKIMKGEATADIITQEAIKALNPGKFGPMSAPFMMSRLSGLNMDEMGNFFIQASEGAPGYPYIANAKALVDEGKYQEAIDVLNDPEAPFNQFPDAMIRTWKAALASSAGNWQDAVQDMEKALALAPLDDALYKKAGEIFRQSGISGPKVFVNGVKPDFDVKPFIESGRTLVPFRALAETMGASVGWDSATQTVTVSKGDKTIKMIIGSKNASINGKQITLDVPPKVVNNRTVVPLRFIGENLDADVGYDGATEMIKVLPKTISLPN